MKATAVALPALLALAACIDSAGPRPRPGGTTDSLPPDTTAPQLLWYELQPRAITPGTTDSVRIQLAVSGTPDVVQVVTRTADTFILTRGTNGIYTGKLAAAPLLFNYHAGDMHNSAGAIALVKPGKSSQFTLIVNVKDATVPVVNPVFLGADIQATDHVVNIRYDSIFAGAAVPTAPIRTFYADFPDLFQFLAVIEQVQSPHDRFLTLVRNQVRGIGAPIIDNGRAYGSDAVLEAIIDYPLDTAYDPAETSNLHDMGHRWMNYLRVPALASTRHHWPLSDLAHGIMGWDDPLAQDAVSFPFDVTAQPDGTYLLRFVDTARTFNDLELYLMGLLPSDSVRAHVVFRNLNQRQQFKDNGVLQGPVDSVTMASVLSTEGARLPAAGVAPRAFRLGTIVLSRGGLLSRDEMAFYEFMAKRGEEQAELAYYTGSTRGVTLPFGPATGGRATLTTSVRPGN